ncbi:MAG: invasion associated locus B family protein [Methyloceanibacter sp.]
MLAVAVLGGAPAQPAGDTPGADQSPPPSSQPATKDSAQDSTKAVGNFGNWTLLCGRAGPDEERCSLVLTLLERESQKLLFRVVVTYGPRGDLVLRVDSPTGVALQRGVEFSPDTKKIYRMAFQTCLPVGCKALLLIPDKLKTSLVASKQGSITVYALNGTAVRAGADLAGLADGLVALDKRRAGQ